MSRTPSENSLGFTEDEIKEQLETFGYRNVPRDRLIAFKKDLEKLVESERSKSNSLAGSETSSQTSESSGPIVSRSNNVKENYDPKVTYPVNRNVFKSTYGIQSNMKDIPTFRKENGKTVRVPTANMSSTTTSATLTDEDEDETSFLTSDYDTEPSIPRVTKSNVMKRKTLRKDEGKTIIDESFTESEADDVVERVNRRLANLRARAYQEQEKHTQVRPQSAPPQSSNLQPMFRIDENFDRPRSVIKPMMINPHNKNVRKCDPVAKHQKYAEIWKKQKAPGEKQHKELRWNIRELMLYKDDVVTKKEPKVFSGNNYQVPSEKKRKDLRWQIRQNLAQGVVPPSPYD
ncbi:DgyrCDS12189 [Dimorphilus gyrociliatus]|uniref:DgyrCDS12189 n=1 Tax=Dimorphilus gyrociliatus TaxID=2664684 RepID=A0A7I8W6Y6_9ANNE|nr:DgyrCDS12189 [Dimorphilus gyrociliatus]